MATSRLTIQTPAVPYSGRSIGPVETFIPQSFGNGGTGVVPKPTPPAPPEGFTINSSDFATGSAIYQDTTPVGTNGVNGFTNTAAQVNFYEGYYGEGLTPSATASISAAVITAGLDPNNSTGYVWNVTWGSGSSISTGYVKFGYNAAGSYFDMQTIDPADPDWQTPGVNNGTSLAGTFLFPAQFTIYDPLTNKGGWC